MRLQLQYWDADGEDYAINDGTNYESVIHPSVVMPSATANFIDLGQSFPILAGKTLTGGFFTFTVNVKGSLETRRDELNSWFRVDDFTFRKLTALDLDDSNRVWYLEGYPVTPPILADQSASKYTITLALKEPFWFEDTEQTNSWNVGSSTETNTITVRGNVPTLPTFEITPNAAKGTPTNNYKFFVGVYPPGYWSSDVAFPVDLTPAGWDTAALVTASKMNSNGYDVDVMVDGVSVDRWFGGGGINDTDTHVWAHLLFKPSMAMTLRVALAGSGTPSSILLNYTAPFQTMPSKGTIRVGNEFIAYTGLTYNNVYVTLTGLTRAAKGSSIAAHSYGAAAYWIQHDVWIVYGDPAADAPTINESNKPAFDLTDSTNDEWVYYKFSSDAGVTGTAKAMSPQRIYGGIFYNGTHATSSAQPYPVVGLGRASTLNGNVVLSDTTSKPTWAFFCYAGISEFAANGEKYRSGSLFGTLTFQSKDTVYNTQSSPASAATWTSFSVSLTCTDEPTSVWFRFTGGIGTTLPLPVSYAELSDATITIANPVEIYTPVAEAQNYQFNGYIKNDETGDIITFDKLATKTAETITIDCEDMEVYSTDGKRIRGMISFDGDKRDDWMTLLSGSNVLRFYDLNTTDVDIVTTWRGRNTI